jgi:hypothetical protein
MRVTNHGFSENAVYTSGKHIFVGSSNVHLKGKELCIPYVFYDRGKWREDILYPGKAFAQLLYKYAIRRKLIDTIPDVVTQFLAQPDPTI